MLQGQNNRHLFWFILVIVLRWPAEQNSWGSRVKHCISIPFSHLISLGARELTAPHTFVLKTLITVRLHAACWVLNPKTYYSGITQKHPSLEGQTNDVLLEIWSVR